MSDTHRILSTPIGPLCLVGEEKSETLHAILFPRGDGEPQVPTDTVESATAFSTAVRQLEEYFAGKRKTFELSLDPRGTEFQRKVWTQLSRIPFGETISYRELAQRVGNANASRAVGAANGKNPIPIVIPCHRVIASDGSLAGFAGGLAAKERLLAHEGVFIANPESQTSLLGG